MTGCRSSACGLQRGGGAPRRITGLQMKSIAAAEPADAARSSASTSRPRPFRLGSGSSQATLLVGAKKPKRAPSTRKTCRGPRSSPIDSSLMDDLKKDAVEFRQKDLFDARSFNTTRLEIVRNGQTMVFEKAKRKNKDGKEEEKWRQIAPAAQDVDHAKVEALISAATGGRVQRSLVDAPRRPALDKPALSVAFKSGDEGRRNASPSRRAGRGVRSARGRPGAAEVDASVIDAIVKALEDVKYQTAPDCALFLRLRRPSGRGRLRVATSLPRPRRP